MRYVIGLALVLALGVMGCSETTGTGGSGADGGGGGGNGGQAGEGGSAGVGGAAGGGGSEATPSGLWTGMGVGGGSGSLDICFNVNADGTALTQGSEPGQPCQLFAVEVRFTGDCANSSSYKPDIRIEDGSFELVLENSFEIRGTFDGETASGEATVIGEPTCSGQWEATPSN